ncbi:type II secretion system F family protein [Betaproteobacteria bacterium SCN2]|jgi:tight adherence protein C|nr:type II secretion system F family protein [Betaproteobacteria bacterium SCN2]
MSSMQLVILLIIFFAVLATAYIVMNALVPGAAQRRLQKVMGGEKIIRNVDEESPPWVQKVVKLAGPLAKLSLPEEDWQDSPIRLRFINAGYRNRNAPIVYFAAKTLLALSLPALYLLGKGLGGFEANFVHTLLTVLVLAAAGYYLPNLILSRLVYVRQRELFENFPDALDLMTVCVEAGLGMDAAIARVGEEMAITSPVTSEEFRLVGLELRAGASREQALRNLALRTGLEDIDSLVAMLVQADRFGTSVADSLRVHSEGLRTKRRLIAEEKAAKLAVKLLFPLIFTIFPSMLLVLLGPAFISIYRTLLPAMGGQ